MPNSLDAIKGMFDEASPDEKEQFLFKALQKIDDNMKVGFTEMKKVCECRKKACNNSFVTKKESRIFGIMLLVFSFGIGLGAGWITFTEAIKFAAPVVIP